MEGLAWRLLKVAWLMPPSRHQAVMFTVARLSRGLLGQRIGAEPAKHRDWRIGGGLATRRGWMWMWMWMWGNTSPTYCEKRDREREEEEEADGIKLK